MFTIQNLLDDAKCYEQVRQMRWPERVSCPHCESSLINKRGFHNRERHRQRYQCQTCDKQFDDLTQTIFEGHHQPLKVWLICLYLMGLNLSNQQIASELGLNKDDVQGMTGQLREGIVVKKRVLS
jgi:transposase-like protein